MPKSPDDITEEITELVRFEQICSDLADFFAHSEYLPMSPYHHKALVRNLERGADVIALYRHQLTDSLETYDTDVRNERHDALDT